MNLIKVAVFIISCAVISSGQGLSSVMDAIEKLDKKLTYMIGKESAVRKSEDAKIKKQLAAPSAGGSSVTPDTALKADVEELIKAVKKLKSAKKGLREEVAKLERKLDKLSAKGEDARVKEMAQELKVLIEKLKIAVEKKQEADEGEQSSQAMDVGGLVTLDWGGPMDELDNPGYGLGEVDLAANVYLTEHLTASVILLAEGDMSAISIDQAIAIYENPDFPLSFIGGGQTFNHGLLSTHLISDPSIVDNVELANPGVTVNYGVNILSLGVGFTIFQDVIDDSTGEISSNHAGLLNADIEMMADSPLRLSTMISQDVLDFDLAVGISVAGLSLDIEGYTRAAAPESQGNSSGYFAGAAYAINDIIELAVRHDGLSADNFGDMDIRFGEGFTISLPHDLYCALEVSHEIPNVGDAVHSIAIQFGLESTVELPGFQRRTLTRN